MERNQEVKSVRIPLTASSNYVPFRTLLLTTLLLTSCSKSGDGRHLPSTLSADVAPGVVVVDVLEGGIPEHYWQYQVQPTSGAVKILKEEAFQDYKHEDVPTTFLQPAGAIEACAKNPQASSPNGQYLASCRSAGSEEFYLIDNKSGNTVYHLKSDKGIRGFAWASNSRAVALVPVSGHIGMRPAELLAFVSGHPVSHDTIFLDVVDVRTGKATEYVVRRNVISALTRILEWSE